MEQPFMYLVGYNKDFQKNCNSGWGCGYVAIPKGHLIEVWYSMQDKDCFDYLQLSEFGEEITLTKYGMIGDKEYLTIGFDTAHSYNSPELNDYNYVFSATKKILDVINNFHKKIK